MKVYALTDIGRVRPINEDSYYLPQPGEQFCAVADGMGGHNAGEVASALAVEVFGDQMRCCTSPDAAEVRRAIQYANTIIYGESYLDAEKQGMGTTFTCLVETSDGVCIGQVGDSRAYRLRDEVLEQITRDHSFVEELVLAGQITQEEARVHPMRNYITRALGTGAAVEVDTFELDVRPDDVYLLCSDGLSNYVRDAELEEITRGKGQWQDKLRRLIDRALEAGGHDNITAMYVTFEEEPE